MKGFIFIESLKVEFSKVSNDKTVYKNAYFNSKVKTVVNENELNEVLQTSKQEILNKSAQWISEGSGWTIKSIHNQYINIVKYQPLKGSSYIQLPSELRDSVKGLINLQHKDN